MPDEKKTTSAASAGLSEQARIEKLLLSQGFPRTTWPALLAEMSDETKKCLAVCVGGDGRVARGSREVFTAWRNDRAQKVRAAESGAKETGEHAGG